MTNLELVEHLSGAVQRYSPPDRKPDLHPIWKNRDGVEIAVVFPPGGEIDLHTNVDFLALVNGKVTGSVPLTISGTFHGWRYYLQLQQTRE